MFRRDLYVEAFCVEPPADNSHYVFFFFMIYLFIIYLYLLCLIFNITNTQMQCSTIWTPPFCPQTEQYSSLEPAIILKLI